MRYKGEYKPKKPNPWLRKQADWCAASAMRITDAYGPRQAGSEAEYAALQDLAQLLEPYCDSVTFEGFAVHRGAFVGSIVLAGVFAAAAAVLVFFSKKTGGHWFLLIGSVLLVFAIAILLFEFLFHRPIADRLFKSYPCQNVFALRDAAGNGTNRVLLTATNLPEQLAAAAIQSYYAEKKQHLPNTEIGVLLAGGGTRGRRGYIAFKKQHKSNRACKVIRMKQANSNRPESLSAAIQDALSAIETYANAERGV